MSDPGEEEMAEGEQQRNEEKEEILKLLRGWQEMETSPIMRWAWADESTEGESNQENEDDREDDEGEEDKEEQETAGERQQEAGRQQEQEMEEERQEEARQEEAESKKEQEAKRKQEQEQEGDGEKEVEEKKEQEEGGRQEELTNEEPPGLKQREESKQEAHEEGMRAQEAQEEEERRAQEAQEEEEMRAEEAQEQRRAQEALEQRTREEREGRAKAQEERREEERKVQTQEGHETTQGECVEDKKETNSVQEEHDVSNRHMTWWRCTWCFRVDNGPHLRTARDRRKVWRAATRAARETRETGRVAGGRRIPLSHCKHHNNSSSSNGALAMTDAASTGTVDNETFYDIGHRNVDFVDSPNPADLAVYDFLESPFARPKTLGVELAEFPKVLAVEDPYVESCLKVKCMGKPELIDFDLTGPRRTHTVGFHCWWCRLRRHATLV